MSSNQHAATTAPRIDEGMIWIPGGTFRMGSDKHYPEEAPVHRVTVDGFFIDRTPVTNRQLRNSSVPPVTSRLPKTCPTPGIIPARCLKCFTRARWCSLHPTIRSISVTGVNGGPSCAAQIGAVPTDRKATSTSSTTTRWFSRLRRCVGLARWAGKDLPTEAEWEFAARGGLEDAEFAWGDEFTPGGKYLANTWQGEFPHQNLCTDGFARTSPVNEFPPNGYGVSDMIGNVWEWTSDFYATKHEADAPKACCIPENPRGAREQDSFDPRQPNVRIPRKVLKGGSHLCAPNYCRRYRPAARHAEPVDTSTSHVGFRCVVRKSKSI